MKTTNHINNSWPSIANVLANSGDENGGYKVRLTRMHSTHQDLKTNTIEGTTVVLPTVGRAFSMLAKGLTHRILPFHTAPVQSIEQMGKEYMFSTENNTYKLEVLDELDTPSQNN